MISMKATVDTMALVGVKVTDMTYDTPLAYLSGCWGGGEGEGVREKLRFCGLCLQGGHMTERQKLASHTGLSAAISCD